MRLLVLLLFHHLVDLIVSEPLETVCMGNACYTFHVDQVMFEQAQKRCQDDGGNLAVVKTKKEAHKVQEMLTHFWATLDLKFWIGLRLQKGQCTVPTKELKGFTWVSGEEDTWYANWGREPESTCTENRCVAVYHARLNETDLTWTERSCKDKIGFVCKFNFKGMCKTFPLVEPGKINYTAPFSRRSMNNLAVLPHATLATLLCNGRYKYSYCDQVNGCFGWVDPGCNSGNPMCGNGYCGLHCPHSDIPPKCQEGYELGEDKVTCVEKDFCKDSPCKFKCVSKPWSYMCQCPPGFQLAEDQVSCVDVNECFSDPCDQLCINTNGSYTCLCKEGYKMIDGKCQDVDECAGHICPQGCINSHGSFSCYCFAGFSASEGGQRCEDIDECHRNPCEHDCKNTAGSFQCSCKKGFRLAGDGTACTFTPSREGIQNELLNEKAASKDPEYTLSPNIIYEEFATIPFKDTVYVSVDSRTSSTVKTAEMTSDVSTGFSNTWMFVCIGSSVGALLLLTIVATAVVFCRRRQAAKEKKKQELTADSYCWVSSTCEVQKEKQTPHNTHTENCCS